MITMKPNIPGYYAIGDVVPGQALAHVASAEVNYMCRKNTDKTQNPLTDNNIAIVHIAALK